MLDTTCHMSISSTVSSLDPTRAARIRGKRGRSSTLGISATSAPTTPTRRRPAGSCATRRMRHGAEHVGPIRGEWDEDWRGWWGPEPPYHVPVSVLTRHAHEPIEMEGGTAFHFVTDGFDAAYAQARDRPARRRRHPGGASTVRQALIAGVVDELTLDVAPVLLGSGERIFDGLESSGLDRRGLAFAASHTHPPGAA